MARAEAVVLTLADFGVAADAILLADGIEDVAPAGEQLVGIALVAYVPNELVFANIVDVVEGKGEFDDAEGGGKVAPVVVDGVNHALAEFVGQGG